MKSERGPTRRVARPGGSATGSSALWRPWCRSRRSSGTCRAARRRPSMRRGDGPLAMTPTSCRPRRGTRSMLIGRRVHRRLHHRDVRQGRRVLAASLSRSADERPRSRALPAPPVLALRRVEVAGCNSITSRRSVVSRRRGSTVLLVPADQPAVRSNGLVPLETSTNWSRAAVAAYLARRGSWRRVDKLTPESSSRSRMRARRRSVSR